MEHYDGPAFFRNSKSVTQPNSKIVSRRKIKKAIQTEKRNETRKQVQKTAQISTPYRGTFKFKPTYVPPSIIKDNNQELNISYHNLVNQLKEKFKELIILATDNHDFEEVTIPQEKPNKGILTANEFENEEENLDSLTPVVNQTVEREENAEFFEEQDIPSTIEVENESRSESQISSEIEINSEVSKMVDGGNATRIPYQTAKHNLNVVDQNQTGNASIQEKMATEEVGVSDIKEVEADVIENSLHEEISKPKKRALDRSLSDIIQQEENDLQAASPFFNGKPEVDNKNDVKDEVNEDLGYVFPEMALLPDPIVVDDAELDEWVLNQVEVLNETLEAFNVNGEVTNWTIGPTVTQFEVSLGRGVKVNKITNLNDDLKLALAAKDIRIEAPIPGKRSVGIEIPNRKSRPVMLSEVLDSKEFKEAKSPLTVALGVDLFGKPQVTNIAKMPHGLIAGATGSGKSVFINSMLISLLYKAKPSEVKMILIDPKAVEMAPYQNIPHLLAPVISDPQAATASLKWAVKEMEERFERLAAAGAKNLEAYNEKAEQRGEYGLKMPYILIVIDELADLMMVASSEVQDYIIRITQKARAAGIHMIIATQRPSVDIITGVIKSNIPTRIAFMVSSQVDSRTILDQAGAERLLGRGDMLYLGNGESQPKRIQGTYVEDEIEKIADFVRAQRKPRFAFNPDNLKKIETQSENEDELMPQVLDYIVNEDSISISKLQRIFSIGYNRAAKIIDELEAKQYISPARGSKPRDVFITPEGLEKLRNQ